MDDRHIAQIKGQAKQAGYQAFFGDTISLSLDGKSSNGRRVCILVHENCKAQDIADRKDPNIQYLLTSGRWKEVMVPINGGKAQMCVATFYGVSGASGDQAKKDETERLLACALLLRGSSGIVWPLSREMCQVGPKYSSWPMHSCGNTARKG